MLLYKKIALPQWEFIQQELVRAIDLDSVKSHNGAIPFDLQLTPRLDRCVRDLNLVVESIWILVFPAHFITMLHTDFPDSRSLKTALNLPLYNCQGSRTEFYQKSLTHSEEVLSFKGNGGIVKQALEPDLYLEHYVLDQPTLTNTQVPHRVVNELDQARVSLSLRFTREPRELWGIYDH